MRFDIGDLRPLAILKQLPEPTLTWLSDHGTRIKLNTGDQMFTQGQPANFMFIIVSGKIQRYEKIGGQSMVVATTLGGNVTGMLPFSRMTHYPGTAVAAKPSQVLRVDKTKFDDMLSVSHELGQRLVAEMSNRVRGDVRLEQQREKMASLGRLSAGLAHELNNPAAAISRTSAILAERMAEHTEHISTMVRRNLKDEASDAIEQLWVAIRSRELPKLSTLQRGELEEELGQWLEDRAVTNAWEFPSVFVDYGLLISDLESLDEATPDNLFSIVLGWIAGHIELDQMVSEINSSAGRISELVSSVKMYSHMDQSAAHKPTEICFGIDNTLKLLGHKLKQKNIRLIRNYPDELPEIPGNAGELNQVWTNLIDNAIDAMNEGGELRIDIIKNQVDICVKVIDDGKGIPKNNFDQIFDPFFTTKNVGEGTGLGLDIAQRIVHTHQGQIYVQSRPGKTEISVCLPITPKKKGDKQ